MSSMPTYNAESSSEEVSDKYINVAAGSLDNSGDLINTSYRLQTSHCSTISNDSELSSLSLCMDRELECHSNAIDVDELPAFEIRLISPLGRTPSPIDSEDMATPTRPQPQDRLPTSPCPNNSDYVTLQDINAQISPPSDHSDPLEDETSLSRTSSLETIFEGVLLNTPPRQRINMLNQRRCRTSLLEKVVLNRLQTGKENKSPTSEEETTPRSRNSLVFSTVKESEHSLS